MLAWEGEVLVHLVQDAQAVVPHAQLRHRLQLLASEHLRGAGEGGGGVGVGGWGWGAAAAQNLCLEQAGKDSKACRDRQLAAGLQTRWGGWVLGARAPKDGTTGGPTRAPAGAPCPSGCAAC